MQNIIFNIRLFGIDSTRTPAAQKKMITVYGIMIRGCRGTFARQMIAILLLASPAWPQASQPASPTSSPTSSPASTTTQTPANSPEVSSHDEMPTFKVKVNLVEVRVVVRDAKGHSVDNLKQESFQLFDNGKPQVISKFSIERASDKPKMSGNQATEAASETPPENTPTTPTNVAIAQRFIAYLFDDMHLQFPDLAQARNAAAKQMESLRPEDRAAIFTTSGQTRLDFTADRAQLIATMNRIVPRPPAGHTVIDCPNVTDYMADLIANRHDPQAMLVAMQDATNCGAPPNQVAVEAAARRVLQTADEAVQVSLNSLQAIVRRISALPGQRTIILVSPGFLNSDYLPREADIAERALHSSVIINTLDARGLYTTMPDASETRSPSANIAGLMTQYNIAEQQAYQDVLSDLADATGGQFFHNNNDLEDGFRRLASPPEVSYLLGFSPPNLKLNGLYHKLKVTLKPPAEGSIQARKGYYAPKKASDPADQAKDAIEEAVFSQEELKEIPIELHTQFFKPDDNSAKLSVVARLDVQHIHFHKVDGRNNNDVTIVSALFDQNGNFITGNQKLLQLHLKDETLESRLHGGITLKSSFDVKPGNYVVRLVVRDADGQLAAQNSAVRIP